MVEAETLVGHGFEGEPQSTEGETRPIKDPTVTEVVGVTGTIYESSRLASGHDKVGAVISAGTQPHYEEP